MLASTSGEGGFDGIGDLERGAKKMGDRKIRGA
jgi:hypothetical protein